ncbi:hypothetical protein B566_EDAN008328 [Ephemera danica]|nr:hypothetical protein B566_EDAN008328 [Ephemera danica]
MKGQNSIEIAISSEVVCSYGSRGCLDLRSKRYISDGFCTTVRPVAEAVCVARCLEPFEASNSEVADSVTQVEWRCTQGASRRKMIRFLCRDGSRRVYQIRLVTKCDCKKFSVTDSKHSGSTGKKVKRVQ